MCVTNPSNPIPQIAPNTSSKSTPSGSPAPKAQAESRFVRFPQEIDTSRMPTYIDALLPYHCVPEKEFLMKAAQITAPRTVTVVDVDEPSLDNSKQNMIKVRLDLACLCGSDVPMFDYDLSKPVLRADGSLQRRATLLLDYAFENPYPLRPGQAIHECVGTVVASTSPSFKEGDFVLAVPEAQDGLREFLCIPAERAIPLPRDVVSSSELLMAQPLGTVLWACRKLGNLLNQDAVVLGQGPMGLLITHALSNLGVRTVIAMDRLDYRLAASERMRATHTVNVDRQDPAEAVRTLTEGRMADLVFEAVGHNTETISLAMSLSRKGGTVVAFGVPDEAIYEDFTFGPFFRNNLTLIGTVGPDFVPNYPLARDWILQGRMDVSPLITHTLPFRDIQRAYEVFSQRQDGAIKVIIDYGDL
jgi:threonine dehydrogenase-like Zn-dependent dehydrogenase